MTIHISDILQLPSFKEARILTGQRYMYNVIKQVSIADTPFSSVDYVVSQQGDFYLSSFYPVKENEKSMCDFIEVLVDTGASGLCLIDEYIDRLPDSVKTFCALQHLPVIMVNRNVPYASMIKEIMELLMDDQKKFLNENKILTLMDDSCNKEQRSSILYHINPHFLNCLTAIYVAWPNTTAFKSSQMTAFNDNKIECVLQQSSSMTSIRYKNGILGLISYSHLDLATAAKKIYYFIDEINKLDTSCYIGVSRHNLPLQQCGRAMRESIFAAQMAASGISSKITCFHETGIFQLLSLLGSRPENEEFISEHLDPVNAHDRHYNSHLYETMCSFLKNNRDYKKTGMEMFLHPNTIRYLIGKVAEIMNKNCFSPDFCETFSLAHKLRLLKES